jgi:hypothetical protein
MPFSKGDPNAGSKSGKPNRYINARWRDALNRSVAADDGKKLRKIADKLVKMATEGDISAIKELGDRIDGKSITQIEAQVESTITISTHDANL